ncbi:MAG: ABC-F family ATP-binding cassette domain-containing protein [Thermodesulfobacteriota bacterium]
MSNLLTCQNLGKSFGAQRLFENINLVVNDGDRIGLIGPNGSGKSTLLKIICQRLEADEGRIVYRKYMRSAYLAQSDLFQEEASVEENLQMALTSLDIDEAERCNRVQALLSRAEFPDPSIPVTRLSGGWRKRLSICCSLVVDPDLLVMDEPTNHLDMEGVIWLEKMLSGNLPESPKGFLLVSHDRCFLENTVNRVVEISAVYPEGSLQVEGNYSRFLQMRSEFLQQQEQLEDRLANKMRREAEWLSRGPKARATKARYRIDEAHKLQGRLSEVKNRNRSLKQLRIDFDSTGRKTKKLLEASGISKGYGDRSLFAELDFVLSPGSRLGLLGRNGCGKSTLMQIIAASVIANGLRPDSGQILTAPDVRIVSFDQKREGIDPTITLRRALAPDGDSILFRDRSLHVVSWAQRFLFRPDQLETPVGQLSGGEQARILIAELMRQQADILLLDEPTNDLDIPSLDVLEESLQDFPGALVLVTHDRFLLDSVCDQVLGFDGEGGVAFYSDYQQWLAHLQRKEKKESPLPKGSPASAPPPKVKTKKAGRLSYMDQREYEQIEGKITAAEERQEALQALLDSPETAGDPGQLESVWADLQQVKEEVDGLYARWDELEEKKVSGISS